MSHEDGAEDKDLSENKRNVKSPNDKLLNRSLREAIRELLELATEPCSEYDLIQQLNDRGWDLPTSASDSLQLFNSHFLVFNALYQLQTEYWQPSDIQPSDCQQADLQQQRFLEISALCIQLHKHKDHAGGQQVGTYTADQALRDYYLDWAHLESATQESVDELISQFWRRFVNTDDTKAALDIMSLEQPITFAEVKQRYRSLAMQHHPDRGGNAEVFQRVNWALGVLQKSLDH